MSLARCTARKHPVRNRRPPPPWMFIFIFIYLFFLYYVGNGRTPPHLHPLSILAFPPPIRRFQSLPSLPAFDRLFLLGSVSVDAPRGKGVFCSRLETHDRLKYSEKFMKNLDDPSALRFGVRSLMFELTVRPKRSFGGRFYVCKSDE